MTQSMVQVDLVFLQILFYPAASPCRAEKLVDESGRSYFMKPRPVELKAGGYFRVKQEIFMFRQILRQGTDQCPAVMTQASTLRKCPFSHKPEYQWAKVNKMQPTYHSPLTTPNSLFPIPHFLFPISHSPFPISHSPFLSIFALKPSQ